MTTINSETQFEKLYRKQCEEHEITYAKMNEFRKEATNLRALLVDEQNAHERTKEIFRKAFNEAMPASQIPPITEVRYVAVEIHDTEIRYDGHPVFIGPTRGKSRTEIEAIIKRYRDANDL